MMRFADMMEPVGRRLQSNEQAGTLASAWLPAHDVASKHRAGTTTGATCFLSDVGTHKQIRGGWVAREAGMEVMPSILVKINPRVQSKVVHVIVGSRSTGGMEGTGPHQLPSPTSTTSCFERQARQKSQASADDGGLSLHGRDRHWPSTSCCAPALFGIQIGGQGHSRPVSTRTFRPGTLLCPGTYQVST